MTRKTKSNGKTDIYYLFALFFILTFGYYYWFGDYVLFFQEKQSLLIFTGEFLEQYFTRPGCLLEFAGEFLTHFYINPTNGALVLAAILTLPGIILLRVNRRLFSNRSFSLLFALLPSLLLLLMQTHYYHQMEHNLGFLLVLLYFLFTILQDNRQGRYVALAIFPVIYYLAGGFVWIFLAMFIIYSLLYDEGKQRYLYPAVLLGISGVTVLVFKVFLFLQPLDELFTYPLPFIADPRHNIIFYLIIAYLILYPVFGKTPILLRMKKKKTRPVLLIAMTVFFGLTVLILSRLYNPQTNRVLQLQKYVFEKKWDEAIELHEMTPSKNLIGQYFYNIALSETDQLCDRLFFGRQDFGAGSLILPWGNEHLSRGAYFYYAVGLINEAHRWAYEDMVVNGYRPQNLKLLAKTNLINGNYQMAEKYIGMLKNSFNYSGWAKEYETLLYNPEKTEAHPELGEKIKLLPNEDFFIQLQNPQNNIPLLLDANQTNRKAFEYKIAWYLLTKNVEPAVRHIRRMEELGYEHLPRHVEEAVMAYSNSAGTMPPLGRFSVRQDTKLRFRQYVATYNKMQQNPSGVGKQMRNQFNNTFWFYFHFKETNSGEGQNN
jgi:hypothetical protein